MKSGSQNCCHTCSESNAPPPSSRTSASADPGPVRRGPVGGGKPDTSGLTDPGSPAKPPPGMMTERLVRTPDTPRYRLVAGGPLRQRSRHAMARPWHPCHCASTRQALNGISAIGMDSRVEPENDAGGRRRPRDGHSEPRASSTLHRPSGSRPPQAAAPHGFGRTLATVILGPVSRGTSPFSPQTHR